MTAVDFSRYTFSPVMKLPKEVVVYDLTSGKQGHEFSRGYSIGRYNEMRPGVYNTPLFGGVRNIHMGIDIGAPVGTEVYSPIAATLAYQGYNQEAGDYGGVLVLKHDLQTTSLFALYGHLSRDSLTLHSIGDHIDAGVCVGFIGDRNENGGWNPHLHYQLSWKDPGTHDMPGVVSADDRAQALATYPDPRLILGPIY